MGCASQSRSWGHRCRCRNPRLLHIFFFFGMGSFCLPEKFRRKSWTFSTLPMNLWTLFAGGVRGGNDPKKKHSLFILVMCFFFLAPLRKILKRKGTNPCGRVSEARDSFNFFCQAEKFPVIFFKATPWGAFDDHHDPGAVFGLIKLAERSKKFRLKGRSPVE